MSWENILKDTEKGVGTAAKLVGAAVLSADEEKSAEVEKLYGTHRLGESDIADSMRNMVEQLQELEELDSNQSTPEIQRAFDDASSALNKLQVLLGAI